MLRSDLIAALADRGLACSKPQIDHALQRGAIPAPQRSLGGARIYSEEHLEAMEAYLTRPREHVRGRRPKRQLVATS